MRACVCVNMIVCFVRLFVYVYGMGRTCPSKPHRTTDVHVGTLPLLISHTHKQSSTPTQTTHPTTDRTRQHTKFRSSLYAKNKQISKYEPLIIAHTHSETSMGARTSRPGTSSSLQARSRQLAKPTTAPTSEVKGGRTLRHRGDSELETLAWSCLLSPSARVARMCVSG